MNFETVRQTVNVEAKVWGEDNVTCRWLSDTRLCKKRTTDNPCLFERCETKLKREIEYVIMKHEVVHNEQV